MSNADVKKAVVIDNGSHTCKVGFAGDDAPRHVCPAVVSRPRDDDAMAGVNGTDMYAGREEPSRRESLIFSHPVEYGFVVNWEKMENLWRHVLTKVMALNTEEHPLLLTEAPFNSTTNRERMTETVFETLKTPSFYVAVQPVLALYASGRTTGVVIDAGEDVTQVVSIYEGYILPHACEHLNVAGHKLTDNLQRLLAERGYDLQSSAQREVIQDIKEKLCYIVLDFEQTIEASTKSTNIEKTYKLPDGKQITINSERFRAPEALFRPSLINEENAGLHKLVHNSIMKIDIEIRNSFYQNVVLAGGSTMFQGFQDRIQKELTSLATADTKVDVIAPEDRKYSAWKGGSILTSLEAFPSQTMWISKREYEECGPSIVHRKCF